MTRARQILEQVEIVNGYEGQVRVSVNPRSHAQLVSELRLTDEFWNDTPSRMGGGAGVYGVLRWLGDLNTGDFYIWDAGLEVHDAMAETLGVDIWCGGMANKRGVTGSRVMNSPKVTFKHQGVFRSIESKVRGLF